MTWSNELFSTLKRQVLPSMHKPTEPRSTYSSIYYLSIWDILIQFIETQKSKFCGIINYLEFSLKDWYCAVAGIVLLYWSVLLLAKREDFSTAQRGALLISCWVQCSTGSGSGGPPGSCQGNSDLYCFQDT